MHIEETGFENLLIINNDYVVDERGAFARFFCHKELLKYRTFTPVQINHSINKKKGTVRGMHFQLPPSKEAKILKCFKGSIYDVVVDLRKNSETFLKFFEIILCENDSKALFIPEGFGHGFQTLEDDTELVYLHSDYYAEGSYRGLNPRDPLLKINWPIDITVISKKDSECCYIDSTFQGLDF